ncbi:MAG: tRNA (N6-threonylcarbamoyladenosine(37)-N6)-methyltransferase TrmO [Candidatus Marinimicrobia bacterium]|nr:tRNA (N6-threonylcarbamoyladenosine(37)-N6)-methyltransferase TrmO [Candidatus Neomarinimicrobiota bacterium]
MDKITYKPIGKINTPFKRGKGTPIQPPAGKGIEGKIKLYPEYQKGLKDLDGFSHIILLYHMHKAKKYKLLAKPYMDNKTKGIFAIRAPSRPNPIGFSIVKLTKIKNNILYIQDLDILDETPLLDIKPWVGEFDDRENIKTGWLEDNVHKLHKTSADGRFEKK